MKIAEWFIAQNTVVQRRLIERPNIVNARILKETEKALLLEIQAGKGIMAATNPFEIWIPKSAIEA